jgi:hypothetical protein
MKVLYSSPWDWPVQGTPSSKLQLVLNLDNPIAVMEFLLKNTRWSDNYDTRRFSSPSEFLARGFGVCTSYARLWDEWARRRGLRSKFLVIWREGAGHAVTLIEWPAIGGAWRLCSNEYYFPGSDQTLAQRKHPRGAMAAAGDEYMPDAWNNLEVFRGTDGGIIENLKAFTIVPPPPAGLASDGVRWPIKDR